MNRPRDTPKTMAGNRLYRASIMAISMLQTGIMLLASIEISTANSCCPPRESYRSCCPEWRFRHYWRFPTTYPRFVSSARTTLPTRLNWMFFNQNARGHFPTRFNTNSQTSSPSHFNRNELTRTSPRVNWNELTRTSPRVNWNEFTRTSTRLNWNELTRTSTRVNWNATPPPTRSTLGGPMLPTSSDWLNALSRIYIRYNWNGPEWSTHQQRNYPTVSNNVTSPSTRYNWSTLPSSATGHWNYSTVSTSRFRWNSQQSPMISFRWFISTSSSTRFSPQNVTPTSSPSDMACSSESRPLKIYAEPNETGIIQSPGYPSNYSNNNICEWIVETIPGYQIQLFVQTMYLELSTSCAYDYVEISYGLYDFPRNQFRICTSISQSIQSHGKSMFIRFKSDSSITASGFTLKYTAVAYPNTQPTGKYVPTNPPALLDWILPRISTTRVSWNNGTTSPPPRYGWGILSTSLSFSVCPSATIYAHPGNDGYIKYPVYSSIYPNNADCRWLIRADNGYVVRVFISTMSVESPTSCAHDYLEIFDGSTIYSSRLLKTCVPSYQYVYSTGQDMLLRFVSDGSLTYSGFNLSYTTILRSDVPGSTARFSWNIQTTSSTPRYRWDVPPSTSFNIWNNAITSSSDAVTVCPPAAVINPQPGIDGQISYPVHTVVYPANADCRWLVKAASGYVVRVFISRMNVERPSLCVHDYLEIFDGPTIYSPRLLKTCLRSSDYIYSTGQDVLFRFVSDHSVTDYGFNLNYKILLRSDVPANWKFPTTFHWIFPTISTTRFSWNIKTASSTPSIRWGIPTTSSTFNIWDRSRTTSLNGSSCACRSWSQPCYLALSAGQTNVIEFPDPSTGYPTNATNVTCGWIISTNSRDYVVQVNTDFIALTPGSDLLNVYDGSSSAGGLLLRSFSTEQNASVIGTAQTIYIEFVAKGSFTSSTFRLNCTAVLRQGKSLFVTPIQQNLSTSSGGNANLLSFINIALGITSLLTSIGIVLYLFIRLRYKNSAASLRACKSPGNRPDVYTNRPSQHGSQNKDRYQNISGITAPCSGILASGSHGDDAVYNNPAFREVETEFTQQSTDNGSFGSTRHLLQFGDAFIGDEE